MISVMWSASLPPPPPSPPTSPFLSPSLRPLLAAEVMRHSSRGRKGRTVTITYNLGTTNLGVTTTNFETLLSLDRGGESPRRGGARLWD